MKSKRGVWNNFTILRHCGNVPSGKESNPRKELTMPMRAALNESTHREFTWKVPNNLYNRAAMWPMLPLTAGQIRSLTSFTVRSKYFCDPDALDPEWLGLEIRQMSESGFQEKVGFVWHW